MKPPRILLVDDISRIRLELREALPLAGKASGLPVEITGEAQDGREAVQAALALQPEAILMDLAMPVMDGYAAAREIKARLPETKVIALSIYASLEAREEAQQAGFDGFIEKGEPINQIIQIIYSQTRKERIK